ncbi:pyridoxamine 5'-phosphate oxidase [Aquimarina gracilis]|uniref:Pyridoxamine 5'-phosphate oxidase n=1 Tax=Aquimarina gracilis TaxID=874422 RepID=A0ABU5ZSU7_9FLAO|nr:pyridoxamine 5'-phosphate oxidase [Aquimarina gracilis]MEB3345034.1 pyridoxamine 5'-phosphate oxidase [Aquimarina gracilis]
MNASKDHNPIEHFQKWFHEVDTQFPEEETNAMFLSTIGKDGFPKSRIVLLKRFTWEGFIFFTNYNSEKGKAIAQNDRVSISFHWASAKREVFISGKAEKIPNNLSEGYFESRPEGSKLSTWVSNQSETIASRKVLDDRLKHFESKFKNKTIPKPEYWGGYIIKPYTLEFIENPKSARFCMVTKYTLQQDYSWSKHINYHFQ